MRELDTISGLILTEAIRAHRRLGPGVYESVYEAVLERALTRHGLRVERQYPVPIQYDGIDFEEGFRADLLVDGRVIVEIKSVEKLAPVHTQQVLTYLRLGGFQLGLLLNFGAGMLKDGMKRIVNSYEPTSGSLLRVNREPPDQPAVVSA